MALYPFLGYDHRISEAKVLFWPIPYDRTACYVPGSRFGPSALLEASFYVEDWDEQFQQDLTKRIPWTTLNSLEINAAGPKEMVEKIQKEAQGWIQSGRLLFSLGGEHTITLPLVEAHRNLWPELGVVQIDAHCDLRHTYENSTYSHATVMRRIVEQNIPLWQIGIRSLSEEEYHFLESHPSQIHTLYAHQIRHYSPKDWEKIFQDLPPYIYLTIDLDGFDPSVFPGVGTPEPGGITWYQGLEILQALCHARPIVGVDVVELIPQPYHRQSEYGAAKLVYKVLNFIFSPQGQGIG